MTSVPSRSPKVVRDDYESQLNDHWEAKQNDDINLLLGKEDGLYHHHYAVGDFDRTVLTAPTDQRQQLILNEMHRMESEQVALILDGLGAPPPTTRLLDAGSGRGGTSFMVHDRFGCRVDGVNFCEHHLAFSRELAERRGCADSVRFHYANMAATGFPNASFQYVVTNETTMYVDLFETFAEFARLLKPGGRYVLVTWCENDSVATPGTRPEVDAIDAHYVCHIHRRSTYFRALAANGLVPSTVRDLTTEAMPYWELRSHSDLSTGVEEPFLNGYRSNRLNYLVIVAEKARTSEQTVS
ncbi:MULTISPECIES: methyltransferase domain-containing protein [unclassified Streptomyces]|uniref:SAM-dependent methyltransferase n=1 Tax=unclassified Streptomyces TaxID=2593676 RepID=UPI002E16520A|nr:methyltransferase domain-containing protein [Streptomyces sp. NBC_01197]WSS49061.1 methyltransferase domain-containing protein [Streptomyces sp. NBC_01180]